MVKFTKFLFLSLLLLSLPAGLWGRGDVRFTGDYLLYSDDHSFVYGSGNIFLKKDDTEVKGDVLYLDVGTLSGVIYGNVESKEGTQTRKCEALFFTLFPLRFLYESFSEKILKEGDPGISDYLRKRAPGELKKSDLHFEFREFRINKYGRIKAKTIIPYVMGLPTVPLKKFTVRPGRTPDKTMVRFKNLSVFGLEGLAVTFLGRLREKFVAGDFDIKLYERELLDLDGPKRGVMISGKSDFKIKNKKFLNFSTLANSGDQSFSLNLTHSLDFKHFNYSISQAVSGRKDTPTFFNLASAFTVKKILIFSPTLNFGYDWKQSVIYGISTPINIWKKLSWNVRWERKTIKNSYTSDTSDLATSLGFSSSLLSLSTNYNFSKNLVDASLRQNFSVNLRFKPLRFLEDNVSINLASFYMFSSIPSAGESITKNTPGINLAVSSTGVVLPLGFTFVPTFTLNHLWDDQEENFTDFNYLLALKKEVGKFNVALEYSLTSRYKAQNFWVEGNNQKNMNLHFGLLDPKKYSFDLRMYWNNDMVLENISFSGRVNLPWGLAFSSFILYYNETNRFQTLELFVEKSLMKSGKIQGGYSLALKRFFIRFVSL